METIDRYRIIQRLGAGSFATVWLGRDDDLDVSVAIKVLAENWVGSADVRRRFLTEARLMRRIRDYRIVRVYDIGTLPDGRPFFVMDYVPDGSLADRQRHPVSPRDALRLTAAACRAIQVLHDHDVVHRDITPANLLVQGDQVLIADLGVAKEAVGSGGATMTAGTPSFMAKEQALGSVALDVRADVFSLAAVGFALLTGHPPFRVRNLGELINLPPQRVEPIAARIGAPPELDAILGSALSFDRENRPPSARDLAEALESVTERMSGYQAIPGPGPFEPQPQNWAQPYPGVPSAGTPQPTPPAYLSPVPEPGPPAGRPVIFWVLVGLIGVAVLVITILLTTLLSG